MASMIGSTISHYRILEELGKGGMGVVYKALDTRLNRHVALKFLPSFVTEDSEVKARFLQEAQAISSLNHPHIATIHDLEEIDERRFIVLEYIEGGTLKQKVKHKHLPLRDVLEYAVQMAEGLAYAHRKEIVHRDIKTDNMMITGEGQIKIADFGLAKLKGATRVTRRGSTVGTAAYMSPEQARGEDVDHRSDIFSFGVVFYELITGELPFKGEHEAALLYEVVNTAAKPLKELRADVLVELERIVGKAMEKDARDRYQSMDDMLIDVRRLRKELETHEILQRTGVQSGVRRKKPSWVTPAIATAVLVAVILVFFFLFPSGEAERAFERTMLVVLPFENLGSEEDEYFADGITEEITARLAGIHSLGVISRASAVRYKNTDKTPKEIGEELGVDYVLEGTIRWQRSPGGPSRVRVTPQLIRVSDDTHVWASIYDEALSEVFQVQSDISENVVEALDIALLEPERESLGAKLTEDLRAYDYYLRGIDYYNRSFDEKDLRIAVQMYDKAVEFDPGFAQAYAAVSIVHSELFWFHYDRTEERLAKAKRAVDKALQLKPGLREAHTALGYYHYWGKLEYDRALEHFAIALESQPNNSELWLAIASVKRRQGKLDGAVANFEKAAELDPRSAMIAVDLGVTHYLMHSYAEAEHHVDRAVSLSPDWSPTYIWKASIYLNWEGSTQKAREVFAEASDKVNRAELVLSMALLDVFEGDYEAALGRLRLAPADIVDDQFRYLPKSLLYAQIYGLMDRPQLEWAYYDSARSVLETKLEERPGDERYHSALGIAYAGLGRKREAISEGKKAVQLLPVTKEAWKGAVHLGDLAHIYVMVGENDLAIDQLEYLLSIPSELSPRILVLDPKWAPLRYNPRFQKLLVEEK